MMRSVWGLVATTVFVSFANGARADERVTNGDFNPGFAGWTQSPPQFVGDPCLDRGWWPNVPPCGGPLPPPPGGDGSAAYAAWQTFFAPAPGRQQDASLYQDFTVPVSVTSAVLSWSDFASWTNMSGAANLEVALMTTGGTVLQVVASRTMVGVNNTDSAWAPHIVDVSALISVHAGETLRLRFRLTGSVMSGGPATSLTGVDSVSLVTAACGNGLREAMEQCDDGNRQSGDCCSSTCQIESRATQCRPSAGLCDVPEFCDGTTPTCPADVLATSGILCRGIRSACDAPEVCTGTSAACPADVPAAGGTLCRGISAACDAPELCDGTAFTCPVDAVLPAGTLCRGLAGACDAAEVCSGTAATCPMDVFAAAGTVCRGRVGPCDVAALCTGSTIACPMNANAADSTSCTDGVVCNGLEMCMAGACHMGTAPSCDDGNACTTDACMEPSGCTHTLRPRCCSTNADCDDGNRCTADSCLGPMMGCAHEPVANCGGDAGPIDAGAADAAARDASTRSDSGGSAASSTGSCGCAAAGAMRSSSGALVALALGLWFSVRRTRRRSSETRA